MSQEITSKVVFIKSKDKEVDSTEYTVDAINSYISSLDSCKELKFVDYYYINNQEEFLVTDNIYCKANTLESDENNNITSYSLELYSYDLKLGQLKEFIDELKKKYFYQQNNKLGNQKYYFDEHHVSLMRNSDNSIKFSMAPNELSFTMTQFNTNKSLKNVFGKHLHVVKERMDLFCNNPDWYKDKGIPYTLGILLHGPPGTGKTSLIKAIAKDTNRHIFNIKLLPDTTKTQLNNLFFNETVKVIRNGKTEMYSIPLDERIYVMEDIDCDSDILLDRKEVKETEISKLPDFTKHENSFESRYEEFRFGQNKYSNFGISEPQNNNIPQSTYTNQLIEEDTSEQVTLSFILNLLDGILETPGRILIMTSNYPDRLDKALIRPGRIDINLRVGYCDIEMIQEMFEYFYKLSDNKFNFSNCIVKNNLTPAQLNKILLDNFNNPRKAYQEIIDMIE